MKTKLKKLIRKYKQPICFAGMVLSLIGMVSTGTIQRLIYILRINLGTA